MNALKRYQNDYIKNKDILPTFDGNFLNKRDSFSKFRDKKSYTKGLCYSSNEIRLIKQVKEILSNNNTLEIVRKKIHIEGTHKLSEDYEFKILNIHNINPNIDVDNDFCKERISLDFKVNHQVVTSKKHSLESNNGKHDETWLHGDHHHHRKHKINNEHEMAFTDSSYESHSSVLSFRNQITSHKPKTKSQKKFKIKSSNLTARKFFRHKVRVVIALLKLMDYAFLKFKIYLRITQETKMDNITDLVTDTFTAPTDSDKILFNKDYYKAKKETDLGKEIQYALTVPPESRTPEQIKLARNGLLKMESFAEYPVNMQEKICRCAFYQKIPPKRVIIRQAQVADSFYFIFSGQAMVTVLDEDKKTGEVKNRILAVLRDGTCFGELAFLYNTTRTATVTSLTAMELLSIGRDDFYDIFMSNRGQEPEHIQFLRKCEFTKHWPIQVLLQNPTSCVFHYYKRNQVIVSDSTKSEYIFIIKSGTCQVLKKLENVKPKKLLHSRPQMSKESFLTDTYKSKLDRKLKKNIIEAKQSIPWSFTHLEEPQNKENVEPVFLQIQLLKAGDTFGLNILKFDDTDVNLPNPELSLISNGSEVLMLKKDIFLKYADEKVKENIRHMLQPFAPTSEMQKKLQTAADWKYFKSKHMNEMYANLKKQTRSTTNLRT